MQQQIHTPPDIANGNGLGHFNQVEKISEDDDFIRQAVDQADLPALLATLAMITGDTLLIAPDLEPPTPPMLTAIAPQGLNKLSRHNFKKSINKVLGFPLVQSQLVKQSVCQLGLGQGCGVQRVKGKFHEEIITAKRKPFALCLS